MQPLPFTNTKLRFPQSRRPQLYVSTWASIVTELDVLGFTKEAPFHFKHTTTADRVAAASTFEISDMPLSLYVGTGSSTLSRREVFCLIELRLEGRTASLLLAGLLDASGGLGMGSLERSTMGKGNTRSVTGTDPAANVEISESVPTNAIWKVESIRFQLVTDANVADRTVQVIIDDGTNVLWTNRVHDVQQASETRQYNFGVEESYHATEDATGDLHAPLPLILLDQGYRIRTSTTNRQVTDNYGAPQIAVQEWIEE